MRVLMLADFYPPDYIGGVELHVQTLSRELVRRGYDVAIATTRNHAESPAFEVDEGVRVYRLAGWNRVLKRFYPNPSIHFHPPLPDPGIMLGLRRVIKRERPDLVHAHSWMLYSFVGLKAWSRAKLVVTFHNYGLVCPTATYVHFGKVCTGRGGFLKCARCAWSTHGAVQSVAQTIGLKLSSHMHRYVDRYTVVSSAVYDASLHAVARRPIAVVPPTSISERTQDESNSARRPAFLPRTDDYILFVGRAHANSHKGLGVLLDAYAGLADPPPLVAIVPEEANVMASQRVPAGVTVAHKIPHEQVMAAWAHCAFGVVPSIWPDPCPLAAVEAMVSGKPVIASATGGLRDEVVDGETGLLVPAGDVTALREALDTLLADPARQVRMGEAGRQRAGMFMAGTITNRIEQIYAEVLA